VKTKRPLVGISLLSVLFCAAALAAAALAAPAAPAKPFQVCIEKGGQAGPEIAGSMVVWTDDRNGNFDIYGKDLAAAGGKDFAVCSKTAAQSNPAITQMDVAGGSQYLVVWVDGRNHRSSFTDIYGRNLTTKKDLVVARSKTIKWFPAIADQWVLWVESVKASGPYTIRAHDIATGKSYTVATSNVLSPLAVARRTVNAKVVYTAVYVTGAGDITGRNLPDKTPFVIANTSKFEWSPDISGDTVVWWEAGGRIMRKSLIGGSRGFVANGSRPRISGDTVVWDGGGHGGEMVIDYTPGAAVQARRLSSTKVVTLAQKNLTCLFPAISGRTVVWESGPAQRVFAHIHIYGAKL
jgi:beta propeller repeat protein